MPKDAGWIQTKLLVILIPASPVLIVLILDGSSCWIHDLCWVHFGLIQVFPCNIGHSPSTLAPAERHQTTKVSLPTSSHSLCDLHTVYQMDANAYAIYTISHTKLPTQALSSMGFPCHLVQTDMNHWNTDCTSCTQSNCSCGNNNSMAMDTKSGCCPPILYHLPFANHQLLPVNH